MKGEQCTRFFGYIDHQGFVSIFLWEVINIRINLGSECCFFTECCFVLPCICLSICLIFLCLGICALQTASRFVKGCNQNNSNKGHDEVVRVQRVQLGGRRGTAGSVRGQEGYSGFS